MMSNPQVLLGDGRATRAQQRSWLLASSLAVALTASAFASPQPQELRLVATPGVASATAAEHAGSRASRATTAADLCMEDLWVTTNGPVWSREPRCIEPPGEIFAGQPLGVQVYARDSKGRLVCNALVELTWNLGGERTVVTTRTNGLGRASVRRFVPEGCRGKRCTIAVRVTQGGLEGLAYSTFVTQ